MDPRTQVFIHDSTVAFTATFPSLSLNAEEPLILQTSELLRGLMLSTPFISFFYTQNAALTSAFFQFVFADGRQFDTFHTYASLGDLNPAQSFSQTSAFLQSEQDTINRVNQNCITLRARFGAIAVVAVTPQYEVLQVPIIVAPQNALAQVGRRFLYQIVSLGFPTSWGATGLPPSLSIEPTTGVITGIPTLAEAGFYPITLSATNRFGTSTVPLALAVEALPVITSPLTLAVPQMGTVSYQITASGFATSFNAAPLPPHLTINTATGLISGQMQPKGTFPITLSATNADGTGTATLVLTSS